MIKQGLLSLLLLVGSFSLVHAQPDRWQQHVKYTMHINMDVTTNRFTGRQILEYTNNSPDTLTQVFYHLYWNAFQPGSEMDVRSRELGKTVLGEDRKGNPIRDWDSRVRDRIEHLSDDEIGYQKVLSLSMNERPQSFKVQGTILVVTLDKPILPHAKAIFTMSFEAQVPLQIRRSGRDNVDGVRYSMSQWYPKMCEYDYEGWHPTPYIAREFYGVWGDYDVDITIDRHYILGGTGYLVNAAQIGYGYETPGIKVVRPDGPNLTWKFTAPNVHDFMWAADPDYVHLVRHVSGGRTIHVLYKKNIDLLKKAFDNLPDSTKAKYYQMDSQKYIDENDRRWTLVADAAVDVLPYIEKRFGPYPWKQYSFIQGGDGGMEYPMSTLLVGPSLGGAFHEWMHSWYQGMLGTNESMYPWMDEGFTTYAEGEVTAWYRKGKGQEENMNLPVNQSASYRSYFQLTKSGMAEPLTTHADHFNTNYGYSISSYSKGAMFLCQLGYIISDSLRDRTLHEYYRLWRFKHPNASDFIRVAENVSHVKLDWYKEYWISTTKTIDYGIDSLWEENGKTSIRLKRVGQMPMPIDLQLTFQDGSTELLYVPVDLMFGSKPAEAGEGPRTVFDPWPWTNPTYIVQSNHHLRDIVRAEIDPTQRMADVDRRNNVLELKWQ
ncbi:M1 family metallopeptidase [Dinghuibacter silviterrae]|uniref:Peptidase M1 membrane alanine aminopeptidase domain-containing protein n=1 Tax=Dinghuibacter silviterrae TaxID=1539049 RepID=A0A4R8DQK7_9BACT|nr:M1 family metallopeptidase [Dinghuibacter silviterrae]TDX00432.1 hypothetical protein EDB95_1456 [Dinghuibacter silviterrae]